MSTRRLQFSWLYRDPSPAVSFNWTRVSLCLLFFFPFRHNEHGPTFFILISRKNHKKENTETQKEKSLECFVVDNEKDVVVVSCFFSVETSLLREPMLFIQECCVTWLSDPSKILTRVLQTKGRRDRQSLNEWAFLPVVNEVFFWASERIFDTIFLPTWQKLSHFIPHDTNYPITSSQAWWPCHYKNAHPDRNSHS